MTEVDRSRTHNAEFGARVAEAGRLRARNAEFWAQAAPGWVRHAEHWDRIGRPLGDAAIRWLDPQPGQRILDVGCGCGGTTAELAAAVAPGGEAIGIDLSPTMTAAARHRFPVETHPNLRFVAADIETTEVIVGAPFDAAYSRMTLMLLADPVAAGGSIRRALRPGGRLAATVFRAAADNPWLAAALLGAAPHVGTLPPLPIGDEPGPFACADPARLRHSLTAAGFDEISVRALDVNLRATEEPDVVAEWLIELGPAGPPYRTAPPAQQAAARRGAARLLDRFRTGSAGFVLPAGIWLAGASAPG